MNIAIEHGKTREEAAERLRGLFHKVKSQYAGQVQDLREDWSEYSMQYSFRVLAFSIKGSVEVDDTKVAIASELPFAAMLLKGQIEQTIRSEVRKALEG